MTIETRVRDAIALTAVGVLLVAATAPASARPHHHHWVRIVHRHQHVTRRAIFPNRDAAAATRAAGFVTGYTDAGILGATTADPYERPAYGYDVRGRRGPGYDYYGD